VTRGRILVVGQGPSFCYPASGYASPHGVEARDVGLCKGLARLGWEVHLLSGAHGPTDTPRYIRIDHGTVALHLTDASYYSAILIVDVTAHHVITSHSSLWKLCAEGHPNIGMVFDSTRVLDGFARDLDYVRFFGPSSPQAVCEAHKLWPDKPIPLVRWGIPVIDKQPDNPWPDVRMRAVYVGCVDGRYLDRLNNLATCQQGFEVW
jgi:hypothetical protein